MQKKLPLPPATSLFILLLSISPIQPCGARVHHTVYLTPSLPNPDCPPHVSESPCYTLEQYAHNTSQYLNIQTGDSLSLIFLDGLHNLTHSLDVYTPLENVTLEGYNGDPTTTVVSVSHGQGMFFHNVTSTVHMTGFTLANKQATVPTEGTRSNLLCPCFGMQVPNQLVVLKMVFENCHTIEVNDNVPQSKTSIRMQRGNIHISNSTFCNTSVFINIAEIQAVSIVSTRFVQLEKAAALRLAYSRKAQPTISSDLTPKIITLENVDFNFCISGITFTVNNLTLPEVIKLNIISCSFEHLDTGLYITVSTRFINSRQVDYSPHIAVNVQRCVFYDIGYSGVRMSLTPTAIEGIVKHYGLHIQVDITDTVISGNETCTETVPSANYVPYPRASGILITGFSRAKSTHFKITNCTLKDSSVIHTRKDSAVLTIQDTKNVTIANTSFIGNIGTPVSAFYSEVTFSGSVSFINNSAYQGGGLDLFSSVIHLTRNTHMTFRDNTAVYAGGAIMIERPYLSNTALCFYQIAASDYEHHYTGIRVRNISLNFYNNTAGTGGENIYGASLKDICAVTHLDSTEGLRPSIRSFSIWQEVFHFHTEGLSTVSSQPRRVCLCDKNELPDCTNISLMFSTQTRYPGETFTVSGVVVGEDFGTTFGSVYASFLDIHSSKPALLPFENSQSVNRSCCKKLQYTILSHNPYEILFLSEYYNSDNNAGYMYTHASNLKDDMESVIHTYNTHGYILPYLAQTPVHINVTLLPCPPGFKLIGDPPKCDCSEILTENSIQCEITNKTGYVYRRGTVWVNALYNDNGTATGDVSVHRHCPYLYCKSELIRVDLENPDTQCAFNHAGTLCGRCKDGLSLALGSQQCLDCNNSYASLLVFFVFAGLVLVFFLKILDLTVAWGTVHGLIFYANLVWVNKSLPSPEVTNIQLQLLKTFIAWINLDFGITTCFFCGLDAYTKTWLQFLFPLYIWAIAAIIIVASHYSTLATRLFGNNSVPVLATLFLLSYTKLLHNIITIMGFTFIHVYHPDGTVTTSTVWTLDGNLSYFGSKHASLLLVGIAALLFLWLPYTLTLITVPYLRKKEHLRILCWINKFKPFFDAYYAPLKQNHRYWIGLLLLVRAVLLVIFATTSAILPTVNILILLITVTLLAMHVQVYKKWYLSILEKVHLFNIIVTGIGASYAIVVGGHVEYVAYCSVGISFLLFVGVVLFHASWIVRRHVQKWQWRRKGEPGQELDVHADAAQFVTNKDYPKNARLRESLLDSESQ